MIVVLYALLAVLMVCQSASDVQSASDDKLGSAEKKKDGEPLFIVQQSCVAKGYRLYYHVTYTIARINEHKRPNNDVIMVYKKEVEPTAKAFEDCATVFLANSTYKVSCKAFDYERVFQRVTTMLAYHNKTYPLFGGDPYFPLTQSQTECAIEWVVAAHSWRAVQNSASVIYEAVIDNYVRDQTYNRTAVVKPRGPDGHQHTIYEDTCHDTFLNIRCNVSLHHACARYELCILFNLYSATDSGQSMICMDEEIITLPGAPHSLTCSRTTDNEVNVAWKHPGPCSHSPNHTIWLFMYKVKSSNQNATITGNTTHPNVLIPYRDEEQLFEVNFCWKATRNSNIEMSCTQYTGINVNKVLSSSSQKVDKTKILTIVLTCLVSVVFLALAAVACRYARFKLGPTLCDQQHLIRHNSKRFFRFRNAAGTSNVEDA